MRVFLCLLHLFSVPLGWIRFLFSKMICLIDYVCLSSLENLIGLCFVTVDLPGHCHLYFNTELR